MSTLPSPIDWQTLDAQVCWHPFTQAKTANPPLLMVRGEGEFVWDAQGKRYFDAASSWWVNIHGHGNPRIAQAIAEQAQTLPHIMFAGLTHKPAIELAHRLIEQAPAPLAKVFYSDNGSTALEVAFKMAFQYWHNLGQDRRGLLALQGGYHGDTFGAMSAGHSSGFYDPFKPWLFEVDCIPTGVCHCTEEAALQALTQLLKQRPKHYAALVIEPLIQGAAGMKMMRAAHVAELVRLCRAHGVLVIFDEVMTGFGRTGSLFAAQQLPSDCAPDMLCLSKGLTGGFMPMAATLATNAIFEAFWSDDVGKALLHGHSYTANPLGCAAALASLRLFEDPKTQDNIQALQAVHNQWLPRLATHPWVDNPRVCGTVMAFEFKAQTHHFLAAYGSSASQWIRQAYAHEGILTRPLGHTQYFIPPLCTQPDTLQQAYEATLNILDQWGQQQVPQADSELF